MVQRKTKTNSGIAVFSLLSSHGKDLKKSDNKFYVSPNGGKK